MCMYDGRHRLIIRGIHRTIRLWLFLYSVTHPPSSRPHEGSRVLQIGELDGPAVAAPWGFCPGLQFSGTTGVPLPRSDAPSRQPAKSVILWRFPFHRVRGMSEGRLPLPYNHVVTCSGSSCSHICTCARIIPQPCQCPPRFRLFGEPEVCKTSGRA